MALQEARLRQRLVLGTVGPTAVEGREGRKEARLSWAESGPTKGSPIGELWPVGGQLRGASSSFLNRSWCQSTASTKLYLFSFPVCFIFLSPEFEIKIIHRILWNEIKLPESDHLFSSWKNLLKLHFCLSLLSFGNSTSLFKVNNFGEFKFECNIQRFKF